MDKCNQELSDKLAKHKAELEGMRTPDRIRTAIRWRLEMLVPYMGATTLIPCSNALLARSPQPLHSAPISGLSFPSKGCLTHIPARYSKIFVT